MAVEDADLARRLVSEGATVVLRGEPSVETGRLMAEFDQGPGRIAFCTGDTDALVEFVAELFG